MNTKVPTLRRPLGLAIEQAFGELHLRRYFAAASISGLLARPEHYTPEEAAKYAVQAADELRCQLEHGLSLEELRAAGEEAAEKAKQAQQAAP